MTTPEKFQAKADNLSRELSDVQQEMTRARASLQQAAGNPLQQEQAEKIAARLIVLEAREKSIQAAIAVHEREATRRAELLKSKEYRDAQKQIVELEAYFTQEADEVFNELTILRERIQAALEKHEAYRHLVDCYCLDMDTISKTARARSRDYLYLLDVHFLLTQRHQLDERLKTADQQTAERAAARKNPKPAPIVTAVRQAFYRYRNSDGSLTLDAQGKPIG